MKKLFALLLVLTMGVILTACGGGNGKPSSGGTTQPDTSQAAPDSSKDNKEKNANTPALSWPSADYITPGMEYTGTGEVLFVQNLPAAGMNGGELESTFVYINGGDWDSVKAYVDALKADGFAWYSKVDMPEPEFEFSYGTYTWYGEADGGARFITVTLTEEAVEYGGIGLCNLTVDMLNGNLYTN